MNENVRRTYMMEKYKNYRIKSLQGNKLIIDADYYNNKDNEGEIFFQIINLSPYAIQIKKGDKIGQGIFLPYYKTDDDVAEGTREGGFGSTSN